MQRNLFISTLFHEEQQLNEIKCIIITIEAEALRGSE